MQEQELARPAQVAADERMAAREALEGLLDDLDGRDVDLSEGMFNKRLLTEDLPRYREVVPDPVDLPTIRRALRAVHLQPAAPRQVCTDLCWPPAPTLGTATRRLLLGRQRLRRGQYGLSAAGHQQMLDDAKQMASNCLRYWDYQNRKLWSKASSTAGRGRALHGGPGVPGEHLVTGHCC